MGDEHGLVAGLGAEGVGDVARLGRHAPLDAEAGDVGAVDLGDRAEAVAEGADADGEHLVAGESVLTIAASITPVPLQV